MLRWEHIGTPGERLQCIRLRSVVVLPGLAVAAAPREVLDVLDRTLVAAFVLGVQRDSNFGRLEAIDSAAGMEYKVDSDKAHIVNQVLVYYWAVVKARLESLNVCRNIRTTRETPFIDDFLVDLISIVRRIWVSS